MIFAFLSARSHYVRCAFKRLAKYEHVLLLYNGPPVLYASKTEHLNAFLFGVFIIKRFHFSDPENLNEDDIRETFFFHFSTYSIQHCVFMNSAHCDTMIELFAHVQPHSNILTVTESTQLLMIFGMIFYNQRAFMEVIKS
ncbi:unnamed protein product, partial [Mesorhabditis belari]|uniref:Uncharacterized protein n=1 Tax=Mesorhabditis belari TaxID=2138241 RepID=A0AAF3J4P7_9BILA